MKAGRPEKSGAPARRPVTLEPTGITSFPELEEAFGADILNGDTRVRVILQRSRPGELVALTFTQKMQGAG